LLDGQQVAATSIGGIIIFGDVESKKEELPRMEFKQLQVYSLAFSPDGEKLVTTHYMTKEQSA